MAPVLYNNGLIFSSDIKNDIITVTVDQSGNFLYNLYYVEKKKNDKWTKPDLFSKNLLSKYNLSSVSISSDGRTLYYTSNISPINNLNGDQKKDTLKNGIFIASRSSGDWVGREAFQYNNNNYNVGYPCISQDGNRLYFSARNPDGYGGFDIYYSDKIKNFWSQPVNLGPKINTAGSEVYPFIYKDRLYFASNGLKGLGALDIYYSEYQDGKWQNPVDLPKPFNSKFDDFSLVANAEFDTGYFTSNRNGSDDIFRFVSTFPTFTECSLQVEEKFCYEFFEAGTISLDTTSLKYEWDLGDGTKIRSEKTDHCYAIPGDYLVKLNVIDTLTGEVAYNQAAYDMNVERAENPYIAAPDTGYVNKEIIFDASKSNIQKFKIQKYYWDFGDETMGSDERSSHTYKKTGIYMVRLGLTGISTDNNVVDQKACTRKRILIIDRNK